jgi:CPA1 family monovalent cation:H+ antiporter
VLSWPIRSALPFGVLIAGLRIGNIGILVESDQSPVSRRGREFILTFWDLIAFIANSIVFLLIGPTVAGISTVSPAQVLSLVPRRWQ